MDSKKFRMGFDQSRTVIDMAHRFVDEAKDGQLCT